MFSKPLPSLPTKSTEAGTSTKKQQQHKKLRNRGKQVILRQGLERCRSRWWEVEQRGQAIRQWYEWLAGLTYQGFAVHWFTWTEVAEGEVSEFTSLSSLAVDDQQVIELTDSGRMRWTIEHEGFDVQKHHGSGLGHQFSRTSMVAMKN